MTIFSKLFLFIIYIQKFFFKLKYTKLGSVAEDVSETKKHYDDLRYVGKSWGQAIDNAQKYGKTFWEKAFILSDSLPHVDSRYHYDSDGNVIGEVIERDHNHSDEED